MIDAVLYGALGFFLAGLVAVLFTPLLWSRAVRLTLRQLEATLPMSLAQIEAEKDQLRAEFAIELRRLEISLEKAKDKAVRELVETAKRRVRIDELEGELGEINTKFEEAESARRALEQSLSRRLPQMESELKAALVDLDEVEEEDRELRYRLRSESEALRLAREAVRTQRVEIARLRDALESDTLPVKRLFSRTESALSKENRRLIARLSVLEEELQIARQYDAEDYQLREEMRKLSLQILQASSAPDAPIPELPAEQPPEGYVPDDSASTLAAAPALPEAQPQAAAIPLPSSPEPASREDAGRKQVEAERPSRLARIGRKRSEPARQGEHRKNGIGQSIAERLAARRSKPRTPARAAEALEHEPAKTDAP